MRLGELWIDAQRSTKLRFGLFRSPGAHIQRSQLRVRRGKVRVKSNGLLQVKFLLLPVPAFTQRQGEIVFELRVTGIELESLTVCAN